jgi:hypothetical protein
MPPYMCKTKEVSGSIIMQQKKREYVKLEHVLYMEKGRVWLAYAKRSKKQKKILSCICKKLELSCKWKKVSMSCICKKVLK